MHLVHPFIDKFEDALVLVGLADVANNIFTVRAVDSEHLRCFLLVLELFQDFGVHNLLQSRLPARLLLLHDSGEGDADHNQEFLMDIEH